MHFFNPLHQNPTFKQPPKKRILGKLLGKGENAGYQNFLLFSTMFFTLSHTNSIVLATFILSSANPFVLHKLFGRELGCYLPNFKLEALEGLTCSTGIDWPVNSV